MHKHTQNVTKSKLKQQNKSHSTACLKNENHKQKRPFSINSIIQQSMQLFDLKRKSFFVCRKPSQQDSSIFFSFYCSIFYYYLQIQSKLQNIVEKLKLCGWKSFGKSVMINLCLIDMQLTYKYKVSRRLQSMLTVCRPDFVILPGDKSIYICIT